MVAIELEWLSPAAPCQEPTVCKPSEATTASEAENVTQTVVPPGWRCHYVRLLHDLKALVGPVRSAIGVSCPLFDKGAVLMQPTVNNPVVNGLVRKARVRMSCTCMSCGRVGKRRQIGFSDEVMCASCYTERRLQLQLNMTFNAITAARRSGSGVVSEGHVPPLIRCLVADEAWQSMSGPARPGKAAVRVRYLTLVQCEQLTPLLRALQATIDMQGSS